MPFTLLRGDITKVKADAIVNAANSGLLEGGGVCGAIFAEAGSAALAAECARVGHCDTGSAVITSACGLKNATYIIHAVGPVWHGGSHDEEKLLRSVFGLLTLLVKQGIACNFIYRDSLGETAEESVENPDQPAQLLLRVLAVKVIPDKHTELLRSDPAVACVIATTDAGADIAALCERSGSPDTITVIGTSPATPNTSGAKLWYLDDDNDLKLV